LEAFSWWSVGTARLVASGGRIGRHLLLRRELVGHGLLEVALGLEAELPQAGRVGRGEELEAVAQEAGAMPRMFGRLGHDPGALRAGDLRGIVVSQRFPQMRVEVGQPPLEQLSEVSAEVLDALRRELPGGLPFQDAEPTLDQSQVEEG
jgi:hypothetical protein